MFLKNTNTVDTRFQHRVRQIWNQLTGNVFHPRCVPDTWQTSHHSEVQQEHNFTFST